MTDTQAGETIHVVSSGDLRVHIKSALLVDFVVSSGALRLASPVWSTMLDPQGHFMESCGGEMSLTDDDPAAFLILMRVAHMQFNQLKTAVGYKTLLALAELCDKYDTVTLIRPWVDQWLEPYASQASNKSYRGFEGLAFVAWTLGKPGLFRSVVQHLVASATFDSNGNMMHQGKLVDSTMPPGLPETIKTFRDEKMTSIINLCMHRVNRYMGLVGTKSSRCTDKGVHSAGNMMHECDSLNFGNLLLQLGKLGLWPDQDFAKLSIGLKTLTLGLLAIPEMSLNKAHENCGFYHSLKANVRKGSDLRIPTDSLREFEQHMLLQKAK